VKQRILLFDTILDGHHPEYLIHLIGYYSSRPEIELIVATGPTFQADFIKRQELEQLVWGDNIQFYPIPAHLIFTGNIFLRSVKEWNLMLSIAKETQATKALLMYVDYFPFGAIFGQRAHIPVAGISFRPPQEGEGLFNYIKQKIWQSMLASGQIKQIFSLVHTAVPVLKSLSANAQSIVLADPVIQLPLSPKQILDFHNSLGITKNKKVFLNFGQLDQRKGIEAFFRACKQLSSAEIKRICLLLAGPIDPSYQERIEFLMSELPELEVKTLYGYLHYPEVELCFEIADVVLVTYQGHMGMSSVLIRAAMAGKPVIGTHLGAIGTTIEAYQLGKAIDPSNVVQFAQALTGKFKTNVKLQKELAIQNSVEAFTLTIAKGIESLN
jgi:glycosyltransferase involved in cell wall biosynthesis